MESVKTKTKKQEKATIGISQLKELVERSTLADTAMAYVCMKISRENKALEDQIMAIFEEQLQTAKQEKYKGYDMECDVLPMQKWLCFLDGFLLGSEKTRPSS